MLVDEDGPVPRYMISNYGRVFDTKNQQYVSHVLTGKPVYFYINYQTENKRKLRRVHNLLARTFIGTPKNKYETVDHIDNNPYNNTIDNLRWASKQTQCNNRRNNRYLIDEYGNKVLIKQYVQRYPEPKNAYSWMMVRAKREDYTPETIVQEYEAYLKTTQPFRKINYYGYSITLEAFSEISGMSLKNLVTQYLAGHSDWEMQLGVKPNPDLWKEDLTTEKKHLGVGICWPSTKQVLTFPQKAYMDFSKCSIADAFKYQCLTQNWTGCYLIQTDVGVVVMSKQELLEHSSINEAMFDRQLKKGCSIADIYHKNFITDRKTYYTINKRKQRRAYWCEEFGISPNGVSKYMVKNKKTFKEALEYFGIDTTELDIQEY